MDVVSLQNPKKHLIVYIAVCQTFEMLESTMYEVYELHSLLRAMSVIWEVLHNSCALTLCVLGYEIVSHHFGFVLQSEKT